MDTCFIDYDDSLIGRIPYVDAYNFYGPEPGGANEKKALACIRYVLEKILKWDPDESILKFDDYIIRIMKLDKIITYIDFPVEVPYGNPRYILSLLYPDKIYIDQEKLVEEVFRSVLESAKLKREGETDRLKQFPREYFSGTEGFKRFCFCIKYIIENYKPLSTVEELYEFFDSSKGKKMLYEFRLKVPADQFSIDMLSVIRYITRDEEDSDLYFSYFTFKKELSSFLKEQKKEGA